MARRPRVLQDGEGAILTGGADVKVGGIARAPERGARAELVVEFGSDGRGERSHRQARPVVLLGDVHGHHMLRALAHEGGQGLGGLRIGEVPAVGGDAVLQVARIGAAVA